MNTRRIVTAVLVVVVVLAAPVLFALAKMGVFTPEPAVATFPTASPDAEKLIFVADYDFEPYSFLNPDGTPNGLDVEIATEIANRLGRWPEIYFSTWPDCKAKIAAGEADALLGLEIFVDSAATGTVKTLPTGTDNLKVYGRDRIADPAALSGSRVGVTAGSVLMTLFDLGCEYVQYYTYTDMLSALQAGEVEYCVCHESVASKIIRRDRLTVLPSLTLMESFPTIGIRGTAPELLPLVNEALAQMSEEGILSRLRDKWIVVNVENATLGAVLKNYAFFFVVYFVAAVALFFVWWNVSLQLQRAARQREALEREKEHHARLESAIREAEAANAAKSAFLFNMSHDIRTPMNAIMGYSSMAKKYMDSPDRVSDCLNKIESAGKHLLKLINDVLDMTSLESGNCEISPVPASLPAFVAEVAAAWTAPAARAGIELKTVAAPIVHVSVLLDVENFRRVVDDLISNAVKYSHAASVTFSVAEERFNESEGVAGYRFVVSDDGVGMRPEYLATIFDSFSRERSSTESGVEGTGLGMAIVKRLVELMKGEVTVDSAPGQGTRVTVTLPLTLCSVEERKTAEDDSADASFLAGRRALLVEDNDMNREIAHDVLEMYGMIVDDAEDGDVAVEKVKSSLARTDSRYDFVLMDIQMPRMDGFAATRAIRAMEPPSGPRLPIIALTANALEEDKHRSLEAGMDAHLSKPIDVELMVRTLAKILK